MFNFSAFDKPALLYAAFWILPWNPTFKKGSELRGGCPIHGSRPGSRTFCANTATGSWYCHKCKIGGDAIDLVCRVKQFTFISAVRELHRIAGQPIPQHEE